MWRCTASRNYGNDAAAEQVIAGATKGRSFWSGG